MKTGKKRKKLLLPVVVLALAAVGAGIWLGTRGGGEPVPVYPFAYIGMTEFWGDAQESYGPVSTDKIQTEFLSDTQTVTEVKVQNGDTVKKGDVLFSFDTTLDALSLERKRLDVEKIKVQIRAAEERLQDTREMTPYVPPEPEEPKPEELGEELKAPFAVSENTVYDGSKPEKALICWLKDDTPVSDAILQELYDTSLQYREENAKKQEESETEEAESSASDEPDDVSKSSEEGTGGYPPIEVRYFCNGDPVYTDTIEVGTDGRPVNTADEKICDAYENPKDGKTYWLKSITQQMGDGPVVPVEGLTIPPYTEAPDGDEEIPTKVIELKYIRNVTFEGKIVREKQLVPFDQDAPVQLKAGQEAVLVVSSQIHDVPRGASVKYTIGPENGIFETTQDGNAFYLMCRPENATTAPVEYTVTAEYAFQDNEGGEWWVEETFPFSVSVAAEKQTGEFYVVFKTTEKNLLKAAPTVWQGAKVIAYENGTFEMRLYNPYEVVGFTDHTLPPPEEIEIELPEIDPDAMYTAEQILDMQKQCYAAIKEQNEKLKMAEAEYAIMQRELGDGNVYAEIDGKVVALLTEEEARQQKQPLLKVSGGGGFYIEGSVSELEREKLKLGQEVTVNDWSNGGTYTGEVVSIGDFPSDDDNWNGMGNPTASYYPFKAFVGEDADLQAGSYVSMTYSTTSAEQGIYLEKAFVRTENGENFLFVRGADGKLEKRQVKVGRVLWGSYYEILSPLGEEDFLAFPYGKDVKSGAPTVESDLSTLYGY